jgi:hypothetical protein
MSGSPVKLQVLLRPEWRNPQGLANVLSILPSLGIQPSVSGRVSISAEVSTESFERLFGVQAQEMPARGPAAQDLGQSGGHVSAELSVPQVLQPFVQSITAAPPHLYMSG